MSEEGDAWLSMRMIAEQAELIRRGGEFIRINRELTTFSPTANGGSAFVTIPFRVTPWEKQP